MDPGPGDLGLVLVGLVQLHVLELPLPGLLALVGDLKGETRDLVPQLVQPAPILLLLLNYEEEPLQL